MSNKEGNNAFLRQGAFLALAGIISRVIGLLYRIPLTNIIGKTGNDYYGSAFEIYNIVLILSSYSIPLAISKMIAQRVAKDRYKEAKRVFHIGMVFALVVGGFACILVYVFSSSFAGKVLHTENATLALRVLSPALFFVAILGVYRGFFQGLGTMIPTATSQIVEQIINALVSVGAAYFLFSYGLKAAGDTISASKYGAAGGTLGTVSGAFVALIFLAILYFLYSQKNKGLFESGEEKKGQSDLSILKVLILTILPVLFSTTLYNVSSIINQIIYKNTSISIGTAPELISTNWGTFAGQYRVLINVPVSISIAMASSIVPALVVSYKSKDKKAVREKVKLGMKFISIISFPCTIGYLVLSYGIMELLFKDTEPTAGLLLSIGAFTIFFYSVSTLTNGILQGIDRMYAPVWHAIIALVLESSLLFVLIKYAKLGIYAVTLANIFEAFVMFVLNGISVKKYTRVKYSRKSLFFIPFICSLIMGLGVYLVYHALMIIIKSNAPSLIISIIWGMIVYFVFMMLLGGLSENELKSIPMGRILIKISGKVGLL